MCLCCEFAGVRLLRLWPSPQVPNCATLGRQPTTRLLAARFATESEADVESECSGGNPKLDAPRGEQPAECRFLCAPFAPSTVVLPSSAARHSPRDTHTLAGLPTHIQACMSARCVHIAQLRTFASSASAPSSIWMKTAIPTRILSTLSMQPRCVAIPPRMHSLACCSSVSFLPPVVSATTVTMMRVSVGCRWSSTQGEYNGPRGLEPTRFGDWERNGKCVDF
jgi:hypothetical protein